MTAEEINMAAEAQDRTLTPPPDRHVIGWVVLEVGLEPNGSGWFSLTGTGSPDNHSLFADHASADQVVSTQAPEPGVAWLAMPVMDQGDNI